ncbi:MAG: insulinase family protein, partial [Alphaproteobacteria bacterium]
MQRLINSAIAITALLLVAAPTLAKSPVAPQTAEQPARTKIFNAETFTLENGLQIVVIPNHRAPVVTHM